MAYSNGNIVIIKIDQRFYQGVIVDSRAAKRRVSKPWRFQEDIPSDDSREYLISVGTKDGSLYHVWIEEMYISLDRENQINIILDESV